MHTNRARHHDLHPSRPDGAGAVRINQTDLEPGGVPHRLGSDVGLTRLSADHGQPKDLLKGIANGPHRHLLIRGHHNVHVPPGFWTNREAVKACRRRLSADGGEEAARTY